MSTTQSNSEDNSIDRRTFIKGVGTTAGLAVGGGSLVHPDSPFAAVQEGEAIAVTTAVAIGIAAGAGGSLVYDEFFTPDEDATASQTHRTIYNSMRGYDEQADKQADLFTLAVEQAANRIWGDALYDAVQKLNEKEEDGGKSTNQIVSEMKQYILDEYAKLEQEGTAAHNDQMRALANAFKTLDDYKHKDSLSEVLGLHFNAHDPTSGTSSGTKSFDNISWEPEGDGSFAKAMNPYSDANGGTVTQDDLRQERYELVNGETIPRLNAWHDLIDFFNYSKPDDNTEHWYTTNDNSVGSVSQLNYVKIHDPYDDGNNYRILHFKRYRNNLQLIREEANTLASEVDAFIEGLLSEYNRGEIPIEKVVPSTALWKEYQFEQGSGSHTALALSQLGIDTNIERPVNARVYPQGYDPTADGNNPDEDGELKNGYLAEFEQSLETGVIYEPSDFTDDSGETTVPQLVTESGGVEDLDTPFRLEDITLYNENGEKEQVEQVSSKDYQFDPRSADSYAQDYENVENAREEATKNPEITTGGLGGSSMLPDGIPTWAAPVALVAAAGLGALKVLGEIGGD